MSLAIQFGDAGDLTSISGVVYLDAVTNYTRSYGGKTANHPIEAGASITDHYISDNKRYTIKGVISGIDFSPASNILLTGGSPVNSSFPAPPVNVSGLGLSTLSTLPTMVSQFLGAAGIDSPLSGLFGGGGNLEIENMFEEILHGLTLNPETGQLDNKMTLCTIFELDNGGILPTRTLEDIVITKFEVEEDEDTGSGLFFNMSCEQINFVTLQEAEAPEAQPGTDTARATTPSANKGSPKVSTGSDQGELGTGKKPGRIYAKDTAWGGAIFVPGRN